MTQRLWWLACWMVLKASLSKDKHPPSLGQNRVISRLCKTSLILLMNNPANLRAMPAWKTSATDTWNTHRYGCASFPSFMQYAEDVNCWFFQTVNCLSKLNVIHREHWFLFFFFSNLWDIVYQFHEDRHQMYCAYYIAKGSTKLWPLSCVFNLQQRKHNSSLGSNHMQYQYYNPPNGFTARFMF